MEFKNLIISETTVWKRIRSSDYNYNFNKITGYFERWGAKEEDDPLYAPGPEILDCEISTICSGVDGRICPHCYKSNTAKGVNMSFETWKIIFDKMPRTLTQVAFGIGDISGNPDLWKNMDYCRTNGRNYVVPNITINGWGLTDEVARKFAEICGAIAVSRYEPKSICYDAVKKLTDLGMKQVNIHMLVSEESYDACLEVVRDMKNDLRLEKLNAVVFLTLKQKGRGESYRVLSQEKYKNLIDFCLLEKIRFGMDSCSAARFLKCVQNSPSFKEFETVAEPCESGIFSSYFNVEGTFFPCSFTENSVFGNNLNWKDGLSVVDCDDFLKDIWYHPKTVAFRNALIATAKKNELNCRECPAFKI